jgi:Tol biopolymer transport system component
MLSARGVAVVGVLVVFVLAACGGTGDGPASEADGKIAFQTLGDLLPVSGIGVLDLATSEVTAAGDPDVGESWELPAWSPDGTRLAVVIPGRGEYGELDIAVLAVGGTASQNLTATHSPGSNDDLRDSGPTWSPDGQRIAFHSSAKPGDDNDDLFVMNADGTSKRPLFSTVNRETYPHWSPDGQQIAFQTFGSFEPGASDDDMFISLSVVGVGGGPPTRLIEWRWKDFGAYKVALLGVTRPRWSPDGSEIAFTEISEDPPRLDVSVINADGTGLRNLTEDQPGNAWSPAWSPDGTKIAFLTDRDLEQSLESIPYGVLYVMNEDGSCATQVPLRGSDPMDGGETALVAFPDWQPTGR